VTVTDEELAASGRADESAQAGPACGIEQADGRSRDAEPVETLEAPDTPPEDAGAYRTGPWANRRPLLLLLAGVVALVSLLGPLGAGGIWDPHELAVAELARRIAVSVFGDARLALVDAQNGIPSLAELGRGELPFTSVAVGLRVFGLSAWAGRLPLALWGLVGLFATYAMLARLIDRAAAAFAVLCLSTTPLYFVQARTILGDIVTMASMALGVAGLSIACFDGSAQSPRRVRRAAWLLAGTGGLVTGVMSRGVLFGAAPPALAVALAWWIRPRTDARSDWLSALSGMVASVAGVAAVALGIWAFVKTSHAPPSYSILIGATFRTEFGGVTHDAIIHQLGHAMFPWSALVPFGVAAALGASPAAKQDDRDVSARTALGAVAVLAMMPYTLLGPYVGVLPFGAVFALCALIGIFLRDFERGARTSRALAMVAVALLVLLFLDFRVEPETGMQAFVVKDAVMPASFVHTASVIVRDITVPLSVAAFFTLMEQESSPRFRLDDYWVWLRTLRDAFRHGLLPLLALVECVLLVLAVVEALGRGGHVQWISRMPATAALLCRYAWLVWPPLVVVPPIAVLLARDVFRFLFGSGSPSGANLRRTGWLARGRPTRALGTALAFTAAGGVMSWVYYPALMTQLSPDQTVQTFRRLARPGEPLAMLGVSPEAAAYLVGKKVTTFSSERAASTWLSGPGRRWLVTDADKLPALNSSHRQHASPRENLPVLDARSSGSLLVSNQRRPWERDQNPFNPWILTDRPQPTHSVTAQLEGQLHALGWDLTTMDGRNTDVLEAGRAYRLTLFWQVLNPILTTWKTFVHIDGEHRRLNADHDTLGGKYPMHQLLTGDFFADVTEFTVEPNFGPGVYDLYYGLYRDTQRMRVESGRHDDDRILGGPIRVR
jgi:4-amino-4-deoxy-L-arabinose transferase-like glycosyltransferase